MCPLVIRLVVNLNRCRQPDGYKAGICPGRRRCSVSGVPVPCAAVPQFPKSARVLRSAEFRKVYDNGVRVSGPLFAAFCLKRVSPAVPENEAAAAETLAGLRIGLTVPRAVGKAVDRNRIKRRIREAFRLHREEGWGDWDIVLNPRRAVLAASFPEIESALRKVMNRCK